MSFAVTLSPPALSPSKQLLKQQQLHFRNYPQFRRTLRNLYPLEASRRTTSSFPQESESFVDDPRNWNRTISREFDADDDEEEDGEEEEDRSLDLLVKFVENVFKKISRKARKAVRSVLPVSISTKLVGFSVNGVLILAFLWVLKAFLEVVCTLGSIVFVSILLIRGVWTGVTYLQESRNHRVDELDDGNHAWTGAQPAS
ncbi:Short hypocotyl in white light1 protein [Melia azedarach]|uniref:Short hypocotyl in white light1 protein n=1 Tax=Melia azedarach TaxID=155640 RepID=A0ACC1Y0P4_MELAZ|nr:Short hypocotyl in white light1 protein [Melia azedarach]